MTFGTMHLCFASYRISTVQQIREECVECDFVSVNPKQGRRVCFLHVLNGCADIAALCRRMFIGAEGLREDQGSTTF